MNPKMLAIDAANTLNVSVQAIHKQLKTKSLEYSKSQNRVYFGHNTAKKLFKLNIEPKTVAVQIVKGGTGKTSLVHSIAIRASLYGINVLCVDLDQQGNLTQSFKYNSEKKPVMVDVIKDGVPIHESITTVLDGIDLIPSRIENAVLDNVLMLKGSPIDRVYKEKINFLKKNNNYGLILIDCPPALGQSVAAASLAADLVVAPVTPEKFSLSGLKVTNQEIENIKSTYEKNIPIRIILNKFDSRTNLSHETLSLLIKHELFGEKLFKTYIRASQEFPNSTAQEASIFDTLKNTSAKEDIDLFTRELLGLEQANKEITLGSLEE